MISFLGFEQTTSSLVVLFSMDAIKLYERVDRIRQERGLSLYKLSIEAGVSLCTLRNWRDRGSFPTLGTLDALCQALNIPVIQLLNDKEVEGLTEEEKLLLERYHFLDKDQKQAVMSLLANMNRKYQ